MQRQRLLTFGVLALLLTACPRDNDDDTYFRAVRAKTDHIKLVPSLAKPSPLETDAIDFCLDHTPTDSFRLNVTEADEQNFSACLERKFDDYRIPPRDGTNRPEMSPHR